MCKTPSIDSMEIFKTLYVFESHQSECFLRRTEEAFSPTAIEALRIAKKRIEPEQIGSELVSLMK